MRFVQKSGSPPVEAFQHSFTVFPRVMGMAHKKENTAASARERPQSMPAETLIPDLERPGMGGEGCPGTPRARPFRVPPSAGASDSSEPG